MRKPIARMFQLAYALAAAQGCLPADTRPEPAELLLTTDLAPAVRAQQLADARLTFQTSDGWNVTLDSLIASLGNAGLDGDACNEYAGAGYRRILDLRQPGPQKISQVWGLNRCQVSYSVSIPPEVDAVLGDGVTADEASLMQSAVVPVSSPTGMTTGQGMALHVVGSAERDGVLLSFDWGFSDRIRFSECRRASNGNLEEYLSLASGESVTVNIAVDPRRLFVVSVPSTGTTIQTDMPEAPDAGSSTTADQGSVVEAGPTGEPSASSTAGDLGNSATASSAPIPLMQLMADADQVTGNGNGRISIEELTKVKLPGAPADLARITGASVNLAEALRQSAYPSIFIYADSGQCNLDERQGRGHGGRGM